MPSTIRAAVCRTFGAPLSIETLTLADPGPGEVRVRVAAVAVCHGDVSFVDGEWGGALPVVVGHEAAGTIVEVGAGVGFDVGERVVVTRIRSCGECGRCQRGAEVACRTRFLLDDQSPLTDAAGSPIGHGQRTAAFAEEVVVHASQVVPIDGPVPFAAASLLACGVLTGVGAVENTASVEPGSTVVVIGCGGIGLNIVQGAALARATTIVAVDPVGAKRDLAVQLGATTAFEPGPALTDALVELTGGALADYVFVATAAAGALDAIDELVGTMGALVVVGMPASGVVGRFDPGTLAARNQRIIGSRMGTSVVARDIPRLVQRYLDGELELDGLISRCFDLDDIDAAFEEVRRGTALRNVIVFPEASESLEAVGGSRQSSDGR